MSGKRSTVKTAKRAPDVSIERFIDAAQTHGEQSELDHEVGDLQSLVRALWERMTNAQRQAFVVDDPPWECEAILAWEDRYSESAAKEDRRNGR